MHYRLQVPVFFSYYLMLIVGSEKLKFFLCSCFTSIFKHPCLPLPGGGVGECRKGVSLHASLPQQLTTAAYYLVLGQLLRLGWSFVLIQPKFQAKFLLPGVGDRAFLCHSSQTASYLWFIFSRSLLLFISLPDIYFVQMQDFWAQCHFLPPSQETRVFISILPLVTLDSTCIIVDYFLSPLSSAPTARFSVPSLNAMEFCLSLRCKRACCPCSSSLRPLKKGSRKAGEALGKSPSSSLSSPVCLCHRGIFSGLLPCSQTFSFLVEL